MTKTLDISLPNSRKNHLCLLHKTERSGEPTLYARIWLPNELRRSASNPYIQKNLKTTNIEKATGLAVQWFVQVSGKVERHEQPRGKTFTQAVALFLKHLEKRATRTDAGRPLENANSIRRLRTSFERYLVPFFGKKDLAAISQRDCESFVDWRMNYYVDGPGAIEADIQYERAGRMITRPVAKSNRPAQSTVNKDVVAFNRLLDFARRRLELRIGDVQISLKGARAREMKRRPRFAPAEIISLMAALKIRCLELQEYGGAPPSIMKYTEDLEYSMAPQHRFHLRDHDYRSSNPISDQLYKRRLLLHLVQLLHGTGLRVGEAMNLKVGDLEIVPALSSRATDWLQKGEAIAKAKLYGGRQVAAIEAYNDDQYEEHEKLWEDRTQPLPLSENGRPQELVIKVRRTNGALKNVQHERTVSLLDSAMDQLVAHLQFLFAYLPEEITTPGIDFLTLPKSLPLFPHKNGTHLKSLSHGFTSILNHTGLHYAENGKRSLSCLRHTYASERIEAGATKNGLHVLAGQLGTSVSMIERHYSQIISRSRFEELSV